MRCNIVKSCCPYFMLMNNLKEAQTFCISCGFYHMYISIYIKWDLTLMLMLFKMICCNRKSTQITKMIHNYYFVINTWLISNKQCASVLPSNWTKVELEKIIASLKLHIILGRPALLFPLVISLSETLFGLVWVRS